MRTETCQMISLGNRIKTARERAGFTQNQLADKIGISRAAIARYESGEIEPRLKNLAAIAECLKVSADYLLNVNTSEASGFSAKAEELMEQLIQELTMIKENQRKERKQ